MSGKSEDQSLGEASFARTTDRPANRRTQPRFAVSLSVTLASEHNFYQGLVENLSAGGVFVATHQRRAVGEHMEIEIRIEGEDAPVKGVGEVRWVRAYSATSDVSPGLGLRFLQLEAGAEERIQRFLQNREPLLFEE